MSNVEDSAAKDAAQLIGASIGMFGLGMVGGIALLFRQEKVKFNRHTHGRPAIVAFRALFYGTILAVGSFSVGMGAFIKISGISSVQEFADKSRELVRPLYRAPTEDEIQANTEAVDELENLIDSYMGKDEKKTEAESE